jgi:putative DNA primase/helicase
LSEDLGKIATLQEFYGLCLTREVRYQRALFMVGEGRNGKSTALFILESIVGDVTGRVKTSQ